ncbi:MAG: radical SAM protein [Crocinitomix sp.]|nr:radical SAM protein [Crocinitomix sp.]
MIKTEKVSFKSSELNKGEDTGYGVECLEIGITSMCNMKCDYCTAWDFGNSVSMSAEDAIETIKSVPKLKRVKLSGGEVLLKYQTCLDVVKYCGENNILTQINSNGTVLTPGRIKELQDAGLNFLHFSLNFYDAAEHAAYYKVNEKNFEKIIKNIALCAESEIDVIVETIIFDKTHKNILKLVNFIHSLGVDKIELQNAVPQEQKCWDDVVSPEEIRDVIRKVIHNKPENLEIFFSCLNLCGTEFMAEIAPFYNKNGVFFPGCIEGKKQLHLHSNGDVLVCELGAPKVIANVFKGDKLVDIHDNMHPDLEKFLATNECACARNL